MTTVEIVLKHLVPALEVVRRDLEAQRLAQPSKPASTRSLREPDPVRPEKPVPSRRLLTLAGSQRPAVGEQVISVRADEPTANPAPQVREQNHVDGGRTR